MGNCLLQQVGGGSPDPGKVASHEKIIQNMFL